MDMQVLYERCAAVDVGKDEIAVAVRLPGEGADAHAAVPRQTLDHLLNYPGDAHAFKRDDASSVGATSYWLERDGAGALAKSTSDTLSVVLEGVLSR